MPSTSGWVAVLWGLYINTLNYIYVVNDSHICHKMVGRTISIRFGNLSKIEEEKNYTWNFIYKEIWFMWMESERNDCMWSLTFFISWQWQWQWQWHTDIFCVLLPRETFGNIHFCAQLIQGFFFPSFCWLPLAIIIKWIVYHNYWR